MEPPRVTIDIDGGDANNLSGGVAQHGARIATWGSSAALQREAGDGSKTLGDELHRTVHQGGDAEGREESNAITTNLRHIRPPVEGRGCGLFQNLEVHLKLQFTLANGS